METSTSGAAPTVGESFRLWAESEPTVKALVLIGSQVRPADDVVWKADAQSDWDFQLISSDPGMFASSGWTSGLKDLELRTYAPRQTRVGRVPKVSMVFNGAEADLVVLPARGMRLMRLLVTLGFHRKGRTKRLLQDLAIVVRPGFRFLKGGEMWEPFFRRVVAEVPDARLDDDEARRLAEMFRCDAVWILRKIERGELLAAQRLLHQSLAETNIRLLHELRLRRGERSFPEGRRIERVVSLKELGSVTVGAVPEAESLRGAVRKAEATCDELMNGLVGPGWRRPA